MKIAHLILAHKNPGQVALLIKNLQHPDFVFYIHLDKKTPIEEFSSLKDLSGVFFIKKRVSIRWAGYGTIQATLNGFKEILQQPYDYINVISGQDFPIKTAEEFIQTLEKDKPSEFITCEPLETVWKEALPRVEKYHFINWKIPGKFTLEKMVNRIMPGKRKFPLEYTIAGRANWFTLTTAACTYILTFLESHPAVIRFFKYCWGADEFIFSTILYNSSFKERIKNNLVYVDWTDKNDGHPRVLVTADFEKLQQSEKFFARKFDIHEDNKILQLLENFLQQKR